MGAAWSPAPRALGAPLIPFSLSRDERRKSTSGAEKFVFFSFPSSLLVLVAIHRLTFSFWLSPLRTSCPSLASKQ